MSRAKPVAGYPSLSAAITALHAEGLGADDIVARLGCNRQTVHAQISILKKAERAGEVWTPDRLAKVHRIHEAALAVIAEAFGCSADELRKVLKQPVPLPRAEVTATAAAALPPPPAEVLTHDWAVPAEVFEEKGDDGQAAGPEPESQLAEAAAAEPAAAQEAPQKAAPAPEPPAPATTRVYGLRTLDGKWLTKDGRDFTSLMDEAWSGDAVQAKTARQRFANARYCKIRELD